MPFFLSNLIDELIPVVKSGLVDSSSRRSSPKIKT